MIFKDFLNLKTKFQGWRDPHQAVIDDSLATASPNLKCFKEKNYYYFFKSFFKKFFSRSTGPTRGIIDRYNTIVGIFL
jgi:hypothetical protein